MDLQKKFFLLVCFLNKHGG